jgi:hypothetical protein
MICLLLKKVKQKFYLIYKKIDNINNYSKLLYYINQIYTMNLEDQINEWFQKNTKLYEYSDIKLINKYISPIKTNEISISNDYIFEYTNTKFKNIRFENIFKLNWMLICNKLIDYFPNNKIDCTFEKASHIDGDIQKGNATYKHDVYIQISNLKNDKIYDCAIEYFEEKSHKKRSVDCDKELYTQQIVDHYIIYKETIDNPNNFYIDTIHRLLVLLCASNDDHYILSKVNFFKNNKKNLQKLKKETQNFNKIIEYHKQNKFNFEEFFNELLPKNLETEENFEKDEFIEFLKENYNLVINIDNKGNCDYQHFASIIIFLDINISHKLIDLKKIYRDAMSIMFDSQKEIIYYINKMRDKKDNLPEFLDVFLRNHIQNYRKPFTLKKTIENLKIKLSN